MTKLLSMYKTLGVAFLLLLLTAAYLTYGIFSKQFVTYEEVALQTGDEVQIGKFRLVFYAGRS